jgi:two-component sensor histidine kinase
MPVSKSPSVRSSGKSAPYRIRAQREALLRQQKSLAEFGERALKVDDLDEILDEGCRLVGEALETEFAKVITPDADGKCIFVRAGSGWPPGIVRGLKANLEKNSVDYAALASSEPVIVSDVDRHNRFEVAGFILEQGVKAFVNVPILGADGSPPFGILEVDSLQRRQFTNDDISFLKTYANMMAAAVQRQRSSEAVRNLAEQRMNLLNELQHRLKNNLQSVSSLIGMAIRESADEGMKDVLRLLLVRIDALKLVHEKIYVSGQFDRVDLAPYLGELSASLLRFHQTARSHVRLVADLRPLTTVPDIAVPLGLILTEFVTNSMKYAFEGDGTICVRLDRIGSEEGRLVLADDGKGIGQVNPQGTGMKLIEGLAHQLGAHLHWKTEAGTELTLRFPVAQGITPSNP